MSFEHEGRSHVGDELLEVAKADTPFADLYLQRARALVSGKLTEAQYAALEGSDDEVASLTNRIEAAIAERDWSLVRELTARATELKRSLAEQASIRTTATRVYGFDAVLVDPFSPGICGLAGVAERDLPALRDEAVKRLERLRGADPAWADLYQARREALGALRFAASPATVEDATVTVEALEARAKAALVQGNLAQLQQLSAQLLELERSEPGAARGDTARLGLTPPVLTKPFPREVCDRAGKLGLAPHRVESMAEEVVARFRPSWRATLGDASGNTMRLALTVPGDTEEALRDAAELLMNRAIVTSAGTRYVPWVVEEDLLVEDFDDPSPDTVQPSSPLLAALDLPGRRSLARRTIEKALRVRGAGVVKDLGLDPREYRVVCLPADVYTRLGSKLGWGKREIWTHFDGYMATKERKLMALVGGDVRFGGLHDVVAVGTDYDSDRLYARFAIVQRRRFAMW
jgi:hypothetical protein